MLIDIPKCIGCGNCVRACAAENDVPEGHFRTWVERYHVTDADMVNPEVISPDGGKERIPLGRRKMQASISSYPDVQSLRRLALYPGLSRRRYLITPDGVVCSSTRPTASAVPYCVQACPYGCRYIHPEKKVADKCNPLLSPDLEGPDNGLCRKLPHGRAGNSAILKNPNDPIHAFLKTHHVQVLKPQMATGAKVFYNELDGSVR